MATSSLLSLTADAQGEAMKPPTLLIVPLFAVTLLFPAEDLYSAAVVTTQQTTSEKPNRFIYVCPMHPDVKSHKPGKCPKCKMTLEKRRNEPPVITPDQ